MKILFQINSLVNSGSTGRIVEKIGQLAIEQGWKSYIAYGRIARDSKSELIPIGGRLNLGWHGLKTRLFDRHGFGSKKATEQLIEEIRKVSPDVIHLHNLHGYYLNIKILFDFLSKTDIPIVWTLHDCWPLTGHCVHFQDNNCYKWKTGCFDCEYIHSYPASLYRDASLINYKDKKNCFTSVKNMTVVPVCHWLEEIVKESYLKEYPIKTILNGIDIQQFVPVNDYKFNKDLHVNHRFVILAVASNWNESKGFYDIISLGKYIKDDEVILLIGIDASQYKYLPKNILGISRTENVSELVAYYSLANVFINPTYQDTFPTVNLEALACGTPVITYDTGGCSESIDTTTGIIVNRGDIKGLYNAISIIRFQENIYSSSACRKRVDSFFSDFYQFQNYLTVYDSIMQKNNIL